MIAALLALFTLFASHALHINAVHSQMHEIPQTGHPLAG